MKAKAFREMRYERERLGWTQQEAAKKFGVSQSYLSLLEAGLRPAPPNLVSKAVKVYGTPPTSLPLQESFEPPRASDAQAFTAELAGLGYPGFSHVRSKARHNPAEVLFHALGQNDLESRVVEALPWLVFRYPSLNWEWLVPRAKLFDLQNRLGYVTDLAFKLASKDTEHNSALPTLAQQKAVLERARLAAEGTLCHDSLSKAERSWLRQNRPPEAVHWNLLTDLRAEQLRYPHA